MRAHQLDSNGLIINTVLVNDLLILPNLISAEIGGEIGDTISNGAVIKKEKEDIE